MYVKSKQLMMRCKELKLDPRVKKSYVDRETPPASIKKKATRWP